MDCFSPRAYRHKSRTAKYCSAKCRKLSRKYSCVSCGKPVVRQPSHIGSRVFCSVECAATTRFKDGTEPWNKGLKGIHLSPSTEFKPGPRPDRRQPIGSVSLRHRKGDDSMRAWIKVAHPNKWLLRAHLTWIASHGPIPKGCIVHHKDRGTLNDDINNLTLLTRSEHITEHANDLYQARWTNRSASS